MRSDPKPPRNWKLAKLGDIATIVMGQSPPGVNVNSKASGMPFLQGNAEFGDRYPKAIHWCDPPGRIAQKGELLLSVRAPVGEMNEADQEYTIGRGLAAIDVPTIDKEFIWHALLHGREQLERVSQGSTFDAINKDDLSALSLFLPPVDERRLIGDILQSINDAIEATQAVIEQTRQLKTALLQDLLIHGIPGEKTQFTNCRLGRLFSERKEHGQPGLPILSITMDQGLVGRDTLDRRVVSELKPEEHLLVRKGDIAYNMMRMWQGVFGLAWQDGIVSPAYVILKPQMQINSHFASYLFEYPSTIRKFERFSQGLTGDRLRLYYDNFCSISVRIPDKETQQKIATTLQSIDERLLDSKKNWKSLHQVKTALSQGLLTGRIPVFAAEKEVE